MAEAAAAAVAAAAAAEATSALRDDGEEPPDEGGEEEVLLLPPPPPFPPRPLPEAAGKRAFLGWPLLLLSSCLSPARAAPSLLPLPPAAPPPAYPRVFLRRADAGSTSEMFPPLPPLPPPPLLFPLPLRRKEGGAPLLSAAWKDERRTLSPSGGPASTHDGVEEEEEVEGEGEADDADVALLESSPAAGDGVVTSPSPRLLPPGCLCCGVAWHAELRRPGASLALRVGARESAAGRRGAVGLGEPATAAATGGAALLVFFFFFKEVESIFKAGVFRIVSFNKKVRFDFDYEKPGVD